MTTNDENDLTLYKFNWHELAFNEFSNWAVVAMWTHDDVTDDGRRLFDALDEASNGFRDVELGITLNGVPIDAERFMKRLDQATDDLGERLAARKVEELLPNFDEMNDFISDLTRDFKQKAYARAAELGIKSSEWEEQW